MTFSAAVVLATLVAGAVALSLWLTGRDGLGPESGAKLPMVAAVAALTGTWSGLGTWWIAAVWLDWRGSTGHEPTPGAPLLLVGVLFLALSLLAATPFLLAISIVWLRRIPFIWVLWVATCPALSILFSFNRDPGQQSMAFVASLTLLELSLYALVRIAGSVRHPKWRRTMSSGPTLGEEWGAARTALREAAPTMLRWAAGLMLVGVAGGTLFVPMLFGPGRTEFTDAYDNREKAKRAICDDYQVAAWRVIPNDAETGTFLLETTVRVKKSGMLRLGSALLRHGDSGPIILRDRPDNPPSNPDRPRPMVPVERHQYVILRRLLEGKTEGQTVTQAEFGLCIGPQSNDLCGGFRYGPQRKYPKSAEFAAPEPGCPLPPPTEVPSFVTLARDGR